MRQLPKDRDLLLQLLARVEDFILKPSAETSGVVIRPSREFELIEDYLPSENPTNDLYGRIQQARSLRQQILAKLEEWTKKKPYQLLSTETELTHRS